MQIDRSPSRWPYVAALVGLLVLCLMLPLYWEPDYRHWLGERCDEDDPYAFQAVIPPGQFIRFDGRTPLDGEEHCGYGPAITLEQLLGRFTNSASKRPDADGDWFVELLRSPPSGANGQQAATPGPLMSSALHRAGAELARLSPGELAALAAWLADECYRHFTATNDAATLELTWDDTVDVTPTWRRPILPHATTDDVTSATGELADAYAMPWCSPAMLIERLELLAEHSYTADWAEESIEQLRPLTEHQQLTNGEITTRLAQLHSLAGRALALADAAPSDRLRAELLRAHWGLVRRLECWSLMRQIVVASAGTNRFAARVPWGTSAGAAAGQGTAEVDLYSLSDGLEAYERTRSPRVARQIIQQRNHLAASLDASRRALAQEIEQSYRNANVRVAISAEMLNRFVPLPETEVRPVHDKIAGTPVHGRSKTVAESRVRLEPDTGRWRLGLETGGTVASDTLADGGAAKIRSRGKTQFSAEKSITVDTRGIRLGPTTADARTHSRLVRIHSNVDWIPVVGDLVRDHAFEQYRAKQPWARAEVEYKTARRVERQMDSRTDQAVDRLEQQFQDRVMEPLAEAGIEITPIELTTTTERVVARLRVAGKEQLAGHTPRPRAPGDSLASLQLHESALSNAALCLGLDGRRLTAPELQALLREQIQRLQQQPPMAVADDTVFHFAARDAVRFRLADSRLELILAMEEVDFEGARVRDFRVHAFYRPIIRGIEAELVRDGALGIEGRVRTGDRARMHGVFNKVLSEDRPLPIVRLADPPDARLAGLMITQLVLEDGWLGLAIGPQVPGRTAELSRMLR